MVCSQRNCYSNCEIDRTANIALDLKGGSQGLCDKCSHNLRDHHRCRSKWVDTHKDMQKKWETARGEKRKMAILDTAREELHELDKIIKGCISVLALLVRRYSRLALSGGFLAQVEKTTKLLEGHYIALMGRGVDQHQLRKVEESLGHTKKKLELLKDAKKNARKEIVSIGVSEVKKWLRL